MNYTASKLYPYILSKKPLFSIFSKQSSTFQIINHANCGTVIDIDESVEMSTTNLTLFLNQLLKNPTETSTDWNYFKRYSARQLTEEQTHIFDQAIVLHKEGSLK